MTSEATEHKGALAGLMTDSPKWDLVGPNVEDDIRRAIHRYGADAVRAAAKELTTRRRGRPKINDWRELQEVIEADAREWLAGGDPIATRSNYSIAKDFADGNPGHSHPATMQRIERKLAKKPYGRLWYMLVTAERMTREAHPYGEHIRTLQELSKTDPHPLWGDLLRQAESDLADYAAKKGEPASANLSMKEVQDAARNALLAPLPPKKSDGRFKDMWFPLGQRSHTGQ